MPPLTSIPIWSGFTSLADQVKLITANLGNSYESTSSTLTYYWDDLTQPNPASITSDSEASQTVDSQPKNEKIDAPVLPPLEKRIARRPTNDALFEAWGPLDPKPFVCNGDRTYKEVCCSAASTTFQPRDEYEQNRAAYHNNNWLEKGKS